MNIITSYFAAMADKGLNRREATERLNKACGTNYRADRLRDYETGKHDMPNKLVRYMAHQSIRWVINLAPNITTEKQMADALSPEPRVRE